MNRTTAPTPRLRRPTALVGLALGVSLALTACSAEAEPSGASSAATPQAGTDASQEGSPEQSAALVLEDGWAKAADSGMTAAFGTLRNESDQDITLTGASSAVSPMEIHEMTMGDDGAMVMRRKEGGITLAAGESHELAPGGDHLMLLDLAEPLLPGDELTFTLEGEDGATWEVTAEVRTFTGADETYDPGMTQP